MSISTALYAANREALCELFIAEVEGRNAEHGVKLAGPRDMSERGSQVSFHCPEGYAVMQALIAHGVIGDFRAPDIIRFGVTPLYTRFVDIWDAAAIIERVISTSDCGTIRASNRARR